MPTPDAAGTSSPQRRKDDSISLVVVAEHHPPRDPTTGALSQLGDRKEADLLEQWLADFQRTTGKGAAFVGGHVGSFSASHVDGVPYLINGKFGKAPSTLPSEGGFTGWLFGVDPVSQKQQQRAERQPWNGGPDWISARCGRTSMRRTSLLRPR